MSNPKRTIPSFPVQATPRHQHITRRKPHPAPRREGIGILPFQKPAEDGRVADARQRLLQELRSAVMALSFELKSLEDTGDLSEKPIEASYEQLGWAVDRFREEQEIAALDADPSLLEVTL